MQLPAFISRFRLRSAKLLAVLGACGVIVGITHEYAGAFYYLIHDFQWLTGRGEVRALESAPQPAAVEAARSAHVATTVTLAKFFPDRVSPLPGMAVQKVDDRSYYPRGAEVRFALNHTGPKPAAVTRIRPISTQLQPKGELLYKVDAGDTVALGQVQPSIYYLLVGRNGVSQAFETTAGEDRIAVDPENLLVRNGIPTEIRLSEGADSDHRMIVRLRVVDPGVYEVRFEVTYEVGGETKTETSDVVPLYEQ